MASQTPPPPYEAYPQNGFDYGQQASRAFYLQPVQSQQYGQSVVALQSRQIGRLRKNPADSASAVDLSRPARRDPRPEQKWQSRADLTAPPLPTRPSRPKYDCPLVQAMNQGAAICDRLTSVAMMLNDALCQLDHSEGDDDAMADMTRGLSLVENGAGKKVPGEGFIDYHKTWMYSNSRLPPAMLPMKIYIPTWQIICMAANASNDVYRRPKREEREDFVEADWRQGTKAMVIKSRAVEDKNIIVIAIRGSKSWNAVDWLVNFNTAPTEPIGFLDDEGNACHAGFLQISRSMIAPVAARLRNLLENHFPARDPPSLILTGHSAGGAVASLLYMHMMAIKPRCESELNNLTGFFKRIHCVTFGTPPVSLLPLQNPPGKAYQRNVFMAFANEGDVVVRADRSYMSTVVRIIAAPTPLPPPKSSKSKPRLKTSSKQAAEGNGYRPPRWNVPPSTLSNAGRLVLLREKPGDKRHSIEAVQVTDEDLRDVIFGDLAMHKIELYKRRIDQLAFAAVTGQGLG